jgi:eukaryotic-like serine/threonine-protein kinase
MIGDTISHYRVLRELGRGGMGVVYEAEDQKLGRHVALKFLPREMAQHPQALERFQLEARAASSLNHENICTVYEIGEYEGQPFIAMELLDGQPLSEVLRARGLRLDKLLDIGVQVGDALDAAHHKGIIHRDIKPGNIFVTSRGRAKVLDFGLAKLVREEAAVYDGSTLDSPSRITGAGLTVGTVAYMSPEQARGEEVDQRSDIFSFGAVLYEMATGKVPFEGATSAVIFHAILEKTPAPPTELNPDLPYKLDEIIGKALEKDRELRYQHAADIRTDLKRLQREISAEGKGAGATQGRASSGAAARPASASAVLKAEARRHKGGLIAGVVATVLVIAAVAIGGYRLATNRKPAIDVSKMTITKVTEDGRTLTATISPDGRYVAYVFREKERSLHVKQLATGADIVVVPGQPGYFGSGLAFTQDGNYLYFTHEEKTNPGIYDLFVVASLGGNAQLVRRDFWGVPSFSPDGKLMVFVQPSADRKEVQLKISAVEGGSDRTISKRAASQESFGIAPAWSPDGKKIAIGIDTVSSSSDTNGYIVVLSPEGKELRRFNYPGIADLPMWLPDSSGFFFSGAMRENHFRGQVYFQPYPSGELMRVTNDVNSHSNIGLTGDGKSLLTVQRQYFANVFIADYPPRAGSTLDATFKQITSEQANGLGLNFLPDGRLLVEDYEARLWIMDADGSHRQRLLEKEPAPISPTRCGPNQYVVTVLHGNSDFALRGELSGQWSQLISGKPGESQFSPFCSPDGKWIFYHASSGPDLSLAESTIYRVAAAGGQPVEMARGRILDAARISPDGSRIAFQRLTGTGTEQKTEIVIQSSAATVPEKVLAMPRDAYWIYDWSPDGSSLLLTERTGEASNLFLVPINGGPQSQLTHFDSEPLNVSSAAFSVNGKKIAITRTRMHTSDAFLFTNFR